MGVPNGLRIEVVRDFASLEAAWRQASNTMASYVFQCYDWLAFWNATAGERESTEPSLVRVSDSAGRTVLLLPLGIRRYFSCRVVTFLGGLVSDYNAPVIDATFAASCSPSDFADLWRCILRRLPAADLV